MVGGECSVVSCPHLQRALLHLHRRRHLLQRRPFLPQLLHVLHRQLRKPVARLGVVARKLDDFERQKNLKKG